MPDTTVPCAYEPGYETTGHSGLCPYEGGGGWLRADTVVPCPYKAMG